MAGRGTHQAPVDEGEAEAARPPPALRAAALRRRRRRRRRPPGRAALWNRFPAPVPLPSCMRTLPLFRFLSVQSTRNRGQIRAKLRTNSRETADAWEGPKIGGGKAVCPTAAGRRRGDRHRCAPRIRRGSPPPRRAPGWPAFARTPGAGSASCLPTSIPHLLSICLMLELNNFCRQMS